MGKWNIYHKDGSVLTDVNEEQVAIHGLEYSDSWMGECFVSIDSSISLQYASRLETTSCTVARGSN